MTRRGHIQALANRLGVTIVYDAFRYGEYADHTRRVISLVDPTSPDGIAAGDEELYWTALHELGHLRNGSRDLQLPRTEEEARAWAWALKTAYFPLGKNGESFLAWSTADYIRGSHLGFFGETGWNVSDAYRTIYNAVGPDPYWYADVTTAEHWASLRDWAKPAWAELTARVDPSGLWTPGSDSWRHNDASEIAAEVFDEYV